MSSNRLWKIGTALVVVAVFALGWFLGVAPLLAEAAKANLTRASVEAENAVHQQELVSLQKQFESIDQVRDEVETLEKSIPAAADMSTFIIQLNSLAATYGVTLESITTSDGALYLPPQDAVAPLNKDGKPVSVTPPNFITISIVLKVSGSYASILDFTKGLQSGERLFLASTLVVASDGTTATPATKNEPAKEPSFHGEIDGMVFVLLDPNAPVKAPTEVKPAPEDPAPSSTPTPTPGESSTPTPAAP